MRLFRAVALSVAIAIIASARPIAGQTAEGSSRTTVAKAGTAKTWTPPRTPWGDPDITGNYTNKYEQGTPFERPQEFEGRKIEDISNQELADLLKKRQRNSIERAPFNGGDPEGRIGGPAEFRDNSEITKGGRPWFVVDPPDGKIPPMTPEAQRRLAARPRGGSSFTNGPFNGPEDLSLYDRCITRGYPGSMLPAIYGDSYQIVQGPGWVGIRYEMIHETRIIPLESRPHVGKRVRLHMGDARGHWEGSTLVVETTNFEPRSVYRNANPDTLRIVEKFTPLGKGRLEWAVTVDDPSTWTRPWTFAMPLTMNDSEPVFEYACHEGNYAVTNMLSGSRAVEKARESSTTR
jgi:hypothetical protein